MARTPLCCLFVTTSIRSGRAPPHDEATPCGSLERDSSRNRRPPCWRETAAEPRRARRGLHRSNRAICLTLLTMTPLPPPRSVMTKLRLSASKCSTRVPARDRVVRQADVVVSMPADAHVGRLQRVARSVAVEHVEPAIDDGSARFASASSTSVLFGRDSADAEQGQPIAPRPSADAAASRAVTAVFSRAQANIF